MSFIVRWCLALSDGKGVCGFSLPCSILGASCLFHSALCCDVK